MKKFAVLLAGSGRMDGSEIQESVLTLLSIAQSGNSYQCFSLDLNQNHVTNHLTNQVTSESRNMLVESARIARGDIKKLEELDIDNYNGLIIPGGSGIAYNLFDFAINREGYTVNHMLANICRQFTAQGKPVGFICIAPVMIPAIYDFPVNMTIGKDEETAKIVAARGAIHHYCNVDEICVDQEYKIVSTPAYMLAKNITEVYQGIAKLVDKIVSLTN